MFCAACGKVVPEGAHFCAFCGSPVLQGSISRTPLYAQQLDRQVQHVPYYTPAERTLMQSSVGQSSSFSVKSNLKAKPVKLEQSAAYALKNHTVLLETLLNKKNEQNDMKDEAFLKKPSSTLTPTVLLFRVSNGDQWSVASFPATLGTRSSATVCITGNTAVSHKHAVLTFFEGEVYLEDSGSTNGTWYEKGRLLPGKKLKLSSGSWFALANEKIKVSIATH